MIDVYLARNVAEARLIVSHLRAEGIGADVAGEYLENTIPYLSQPTVRISDARDVERAREIVRTMAEYDVPVAADASGEEEETADLQPRGTPPGNLQDGDLALIDADTGEPLGPITEADIDLMEDALESITPTLPRYYMDRQILEHLEAEGASDRVTAAVTFGLGDREELYVTWVIYGR